MERQAWAEFGPFHKSQTLLSTKRNWGSLEKWLWPGLGQEKTKKSPEHFVEPKSTEMLKE